MSWDNVEQMFQELDEKEFGLIAKALGDFRSALMKNGFSRREAIKLVEIYSKFIYDMSLEEFLSQKRQAEGTMSTGWFTFGADLDDDEDVDIDEDE